MSEPSESISSPKRKKRKRTPKHKTVTRSYCFPIEVTGKQQERLWGHISACWRLRNHFVEARIVNRAENRVRKKNGEKTLYLTRGDQYADINQYMKQDNGLSKVHSQVLQNVAVRVDEGYKRFFDALKEGQKKVSPPKHIDPKRYKSLTYPQYGTAAHIKNSVLHLSKLGDFRVNGYRKIKGKAKTVTVKFKQGRWWVIVTADAQEKDVISLVRNGDHRMDAGVDPGISSLLYDSEGNAYDPPKALQESRQKLRKAQKKMSRQFESRRRAHNALVATMEKNGSTKVPSLKDIPYSNRLKKQVVAVAKIHTRIERRRDHYHKKTAAIIGSRFRNVAVEEHPVTFMFMDRKLAKAASDRAIYKQKLLLQSKLGPRYVKAPNRREGAGGNSQRCVCGASVPKKLSDRVHTCSVCGITVKRDHMSANIVAMDTFGFASLSLRAPAAGQAVVIRGEDKALCGESRLREPQRSAASESSMKRRPPVHEEHTTDAEAAVGGKTTAHRMAKHREALAVAPTVLQTAAKHSRRHSPKGEKALNLGF